MPHPSLGHCSFLPKCCLNLLTAIRVEALAAVQTLHTAGPSAKQSCPTLTSRCKTRDALLVPREALSCSHGRAPAPTPTGSSDSHGLTVTSEENETEQQVQNVQKVVAPSTAPHLLPLLAALPSHLFPLSWIYPLRVQWSLCVLQKPVQGLSRVCIISPQQNGSGRPHPGVPQALTQQSLRTSRA